MKAQEARNLSAEQNNKIGKIGAEEVYKSINTAIKKGLFECHYYKALNGSVIQELKDDGYEIEDSYNQMDGHMYTIKW